VEGGIYPKMSKSAYDRLQDEIVARFLGAEWKGRWGHWDEFPADQEQDLVDRITALLGQYPPATGSSFQTIQKMLKSWGC
jgi:hypothetical protein